MLPKKDPLQRLADDFRLRMVTVLENRFLFKPFRAEPAVREQSHPLSAVLLRRQ